MTRRERRHSEAGRHWCSGTHPNPAGNLYASNCSCGWDSALVASFDLAQAEWRQHRNEALIREGAGSDPATETV